MSLLAMLLASAAPCAVLANPTGGTVAAGSASIANLGTTLTVKQVSDKAIIDWRGFDIDKGETTAFEQPSSQSITLNRVNSASASIIDGNLKANGNLVIVNQNGVLFGKNSVVNVNSLVATTADIDNENFIKGRLKFDKPGNPDAAIVNEGLLTAKDAGLIGLVAPNILNSGVITAKLGRIHLASGDTATVDLYGDGLMEVTASPKLQSQIVANAGLLSARGGKIALTAASAQETVNSLIRASGVLDANAIGMKNGEIWIYAEGANAVKNNISQNKRKKAGGSTIVVDGVVSASGRNKGERGGKITITGDNVALLNGTIIDASGYEGQGNTTEGKAYSAVREGSAGGDIRIGGDYLGQGTTPTAKNLYVAPYAYIFNDSINTGDAGRSIFWSDGTTQFYGNVYARALGGKAPDIATGYAVKGGNEGSGGFVETSGHESLDAGGYVDLTASNGKKGTYFLDPTNISIYGNVTPAFNSSGSISDGTQVSLGTNLKFWGDASDMSNVALSYNTMGTTATGTGGTNQITVASNTGLQVGMRVQLGTNAAQLASVNDTSNIYTITAISGTTITLDATLSQDYSAVTLYGGYVSQLTDKSGNGANATQGTLSNMPLWISGQQGLSGQNGLGVFYLSGSAQSLFISPDLNNTAGQYNSVFFTMNWNGSSGKVPVGFAGAQDLWLSSGRFGFNAGNGNHYYTSSTGYANTWKQFDARFYNGLFVDNNQLFVQGQQASLTFTGTDVTRTVSDGVRIGGYYTNDNYGYIGYLSEFIIYNTQISTNAAALVDQYQSAKWNIALSPSGTGASEAEKAMASDGYSVFAASYLNRLSQGADIILQASNNINLDLQGSTLVLNAGRNLSLTAGNQIFTASAGGITTSQSSGTGGNIGLSATNGIVFNNAFALMSGGGNINLNNAVTLNAALTANAGSGTLTFGSTVNGAHNLTATAGSFSFGGDFGGAMALNAVSLTSASSLMLPSIHAASIFAQTTDDTADITLESSKALISSGAGDALTLKAGESIILNSSSTLATSGGNVILWANANNKSAGNIQMTSSTITSNGGNVTLAGGLDDGANGGTSGDNIPDNYAWGYGTTANYNIYGVRIGGGGISSGAGNVVLRGQGDNNYSSSSSIYGTFITDGATLLSTSGAFDVLGVGGNGTSYNTGVYISDGLTTLSSISGAIFLKGTGGSGSSTDNYGVRWDSSVISSTGTGTGVGAITIEGISGSGGSAGIQIAYDGTVSSVDGAIILLGSGGVSGNSTGMGTYKGGKILSTGTGQITLSGTASGSNSDIGFSGLTYTDVIGGSSAHGDIVLNANKISFSSSALSVETTGSITIKPRTAGTTIGLNGGAGTLSLPSTALSSLHAGTSLIIGDAAAGTGAVTINGWDLRGKTYNVSVYGGPITFASSGVLWDNPQTLLFSATGTDVSDITIGQAFTYSGTGTSNLALKAGEKIVTTSANITASGSGALNVVEWANANNKNAGNIQMTGSTITSNGGNVTLAGGLDNGANGGTASDGIPDNYAWGYSATATNNKYGVVINGGGIRTGAGSITVRGHGDSGYADGTWIVGTYIINGAVLETASGGIDINGTGGNGLHDNMGIMTNGGATRIISQNGFIKLTGTAGNVGNTNWGVYIAGPSGIVSTGEGGGAAPITLTGFGAGTAHSNYGIGVAGNGIITSVDGAISLTGTGGGTSGYGLSFYSSGANILSTGQAPITLTGTGVGVSDINFSNLVAGYSDVIGGPSASAPITLIANTITAPATGSLTIQTTGAITIKPRVAGTTMAVGPSSGSTLLISDAFLSGTYSNISAGSYIFGSTSAGLLTVNTAHDFGVSNVSFVSGSSINLAGTLAKATGANSVNYLFQAYDDIYNSNSAGISATSGSINLTLQSDYNGNNAGAVNLSGGTISTNGGNVTIGGGSGTITAGSGYAVGDAAYGHGINLNGVTVNAGGGGIVINGKGAGSGTAAHGLYQQGGALQSAGGTITLNGNGGSGSSQSMGVYLTGLVTNSSGNISITGIGGTTGTRFGIWLLNGTISSTGTGTGAGTITLNGNGNGGIGFGLNAGTITSKDGAINVTGVAGGNGAFGINFYNSSGGITSTGSAAITLNAMSSGTSNDFYFGSNAVQAQVYTIGGASATGPITFNANNTHQMSVGGGATYSNTLNIRTTSTVTFNGKVDDGAADALSAINVTAGSILFNGAWGGVTPLTSVSLTSTSGLTLPSINVNASGSLLARTTGAAANVTIASGSTLSAAGSGTPITLAAGGDFINSSTSAFSMTGGGRWLIYSTNPARDTLGGLTGDFKRYSCTYGGSCPSFPATGNGLLYSYTPMLTTTPTALSNVIYGSAAPSLTGYGYNLSGYLGSDSSTDTITGSLTGSTTYAAGADVGSYNINYASGSLASALGYGFSYANNAAAIPVVARTLTASLIGEISKVYDANTSATIDPATNYSLANIYNGDDVAIGAGTAGTYASKNAGTGISVSVNGLSLSGTKSSNYVLASTAISGNVGTITKAALTVTPNGTSMTYNGTTLNNAAYSQNLSNYTITGFQGFDTAESAGLELIGSMAFNGTTNTVVRNVGSYALTAGTLDSTDAYENYQINFSNPASNAYIIGQAPLTVIAADRTITYGDAAPDSALSYVGFVGGDDASDLTTLPALSSARSGVVDAGTYAANYTSSGGSGNYAFSYISGALTVLPRSLMIVADDKTVFAGIPNIVYTGSNDLLAQDVPLVAWSYMPTDYRDLPGKYIITATPTDPFGRLTNYAITYVGGTLTANQLPSTVVMNMQLPSSLFTDDAIDSKGSYGRERSTNSKSDRDAYAKPAPHSGAVVIGGMRLGRLD